MALGSYAGEFIAPGRTRTVNKLYEGSYTSVVPARRKSGVLDHDAAQPQYWLKQGHLVKVYDSEEDAFRGLVDDDDGNLIVGFIETKIKWDGTTAWSNVHFLSVGDILELEAQSAIAQGDPIDIDTIDTVDGTQHRHGCTVKKAATTSVGMGRALTAASGIGKMLMVEVLVPEYQNLTTNVDGTALAEVYSMGTAKRAGTILTTESHCASLTTGCTINVQNAGTDVQAADTTVTVASQVIDADQTLTVAAGAVIQVDVTGAGDTTTKLSVTARIRLDMKGVRVW